MKRKRSAESRRLSASWKRSRQSWRLQDRDSYDEQGQIPGYPPRRYDEAGRQLPYTPEELLLRDEIFRRTMAVIDANDQDPPGSDEEFMRGIDSRRPEGMKLFEGYY